MTLPLFPVDDATLANVLDALGIDDGAETSSLFALCDLYSQLGGSDPFAHVDGVLRDPQYVPDDIIRALIQEVRRLRD